MDGGPNRRNKAAFPNFSGLVWTANQSNGPVTSNENAIVKISNIALTNHVIVYLEITIVIHQWGDNCGIK